MRTRFLTSLILTLPTLSFSQWTTIINFETNGHLIEIDNSQPNNIWQIGKPQKIYFDSAFSKPKCIVTDTLNPYPTNNISSFSFTIKQPGPGMWNWGQVPGFIFDHKFDSDSLLDGGYIETSSDGGITWINIADTSDIHVYTQSGLGMNDTIPGGQYAFTGKSKYGWNTCQVMWMAWCWGVGQLPAIVPDSIIIRFTFQSDNVQANKEGWMVDNIVFGIYGCPIGVNELNNINPFFAYPNPFTSSTKIKSTDLNIILQNINTKIYNTLTQEVFPEITYSSDGLIIHRSNLTPGIYFYKVYRENEILGTGKLIIE